MRTSHSDHRPAAGAGRQLPPDTRAHRARPHRAAALRLTGAALAVALAAGCSSSSSGSGSSASAAPSVSISVSGPSASVSIELSPSPSATGSAPADVAGATTQVTTNWEKFFDPATSLADKSALLENGEQLVPVLQGFASDPRVGQVKAKVTDVAFTSPSSATVTYTLSLQDQVVQQDATGQAVLVNGTWKVSTSTLCGLVTLAGSASAVPGCS
ncbi:hypothetical protein [Kitasatospora sp. MBT63]|uniref:hypothetical protein n=1 Tax=Kitasatospora sp. MBT63 TaxID=1444768 RepID=UPI000A5F14DE|nr:hypothetical protein [Kitasatospora sp. MBT63]